RVLHRIGGVDTIDLGSFKNYVGFDLEGAQGSGGVGGEIRITGTGRKNNDAVFFQVAHCAATDEWLGKLRDVDCRHHPCLHFELFERVLQHHRIHHRGQHADVVSGGAVHVSSAFGDAAKNVATAHYHHDLHTQLVNGLQFFRYHLGNVNVDAVVLFAHEGFAGNLQEH